MGEGPERCDLPGDVRLVVVPADSVRGYALDCVGRPRGLRLSADDGSSGFDGAEGSRAEVKGEDEILRKK